MHRNSSLGQRETTVKTVITTALVLRAVNAAVLQADGIQCMFEQYFRAQAKVETNTQCTHTGMTTLCGGRFYGY